jgi:hypothetical protein
MAKEPQLEYFYRHWPDGTKCSEFEECQEFIVSRHGFDKTTDKRYCPRHCPLGDLYMKKYQPKEYTEHVKMMKERG